MNTIKKMPAPRWQAGVTSAKQETKNLSEYSTQKIEFNENPLPHNKVAEIGVLSACIADSLKLETVREIIAPDDFYTGEAKAVFTRMLELHGKHSSLTGVPFLVRLEQSLEFHEDYLKFQELFDEIRPITGTTALNFARIVREMSDRREIIRLTYEVNKKAFDPAFDITEITEELAKPLSHLGWI